MKTNKFLLLFFGVILLVNFAFAAEGEGIVKDGYEISTDSVNRTIFDGSFLEEFIIIKNLEKSLLDVKVSVSSELVDYVILDSDGFSVGPENSTVYSFMLKGTQKGTVSGTLSFSGDIIETLDVSLRVGDEVEEPFFFVETELEKTNFNTLDDLEFSIIFNFINQEITEEVNFSYFLIDENNISTLLDSELINVSSSFKEIKKFDFPEDSALGEYTLTVNAVSARDDGSSNSFFELKEHFLFIKLFGFLPLWLLFSILFLIGLIWLIIWLIKRKIKAGKKYSMELETSKLPKQSKDSLFLGKVAETNIKAYLEPDRLKTHTIVAGATGGGKSISAQVIVEEALLHNTAVIVFDPTAQWSGMLRKCEDKKMMSYYPQFHLKPADAKAFPGNIRMVSDARELIDVEKYSNPGQIQIFAMNKLEPKDIDLFVANVIRGIFKSDPKENPDLKLLIVFDEVHRLLAKFGGTGEGFLQIERACREFRKWGIGVMLVSQVLSDFVGSIKANINTEVQMRTRDEGDLGRIETKYGETFLQSLVKASVGVGMFTNPFYNKGKPYFMQFRPILHSVRRLTDEDLEKYNQYNERVDQIEFEIETLEGKKMDMFDLKMELKLVKDKIMTGNFSVVDIYLQGLEPRLAKQWDKLGEKPPKLEKKLASLEEIQRSIEEARKAREAYEAAEAKKNGGKIGGNAPTEEVPTKIQEKIVASLTFDNGMMLSSLQELVDVLPGVDGEFFNPVAEKNGISEWAKKIDEDLAKSLDGVTDKAEVVKISQEFIKSKGPKEEKKDEATEEDSEDEE